MNDFFTNNLKALTKAGYKNTLISALTAENIFPLIQTKNGQYTCNIDGIYVASNYNPDKEAQKFVSLHDFDNNDTVILYGSGLGYNFKYFLDKISDSGCFFCIEANIRLLKTTLCINDYSKEILNKNFIIIAGATNNELISSFNENIFLRVSNKDEDKIKIIIHEGSFKLIPEEYNFIKNSLEIIKFNRNSDNIFDDLKNENLLSNLNELFQSHGVFELNKILDNKPIIFIGAGPSLDYNLPIIKSYQNHAFIIAVDTAFIPLTENQIYPDFVVSVDPQKKSLYNFINLKNINTHLILLPTSAKEIVKKIPCKKFFTIQENSKISKFFEHKLDFLGTTKGGSAVSVIGADIAMQYSKGFIIFAGMDFSYPGYKAYANKTPEFNAWHGKCGNYMTLETISMNLIFSRKTVFLEGYDNKKIPSFQSMQSYLQSLEVLIEHRKRKNIYNLNPKGAKIKGTLAINEEVLKTLLPSEIIKNFKLKEPCFEKDLIEFCYNKITNIQKS